MRLHTKSCFLCALISLIFLTATSDVRGEDKHYGLYEASLGVLDHDTDHLWSGFSRESGVDLNAEVLFDSVGGLFGGDFHPAFGASVNTSGDTSKAYAGLRWRYEFEQGIFVGLGLGAAVHNGETKLVRNDKKALGSRLLFHIPFEAGYRFTETYSMSIYFDHISNGYTQDENEGMDTLGLRFGVRF